MKTKTNWMDNAQVKRELIDLLRTEPRARWVDVIMAKYGGTQEGRVAVFQVFCSMEQAGELDDLKRANPLAKTVALALTMALAAFSSASADDHKEKRSEHHNYILERQSAGQVEGVPTTRRIVGKREIDGYSQGGATVWFEKNNVVGVTK